jgi:hypothetical protein
MPLQAEPCDGLTRVALHFSRAPLAKAVSETKLPREDRAYPVTIKKAVANGLRTALGKVAVPGYWVPRSGARKAAKTAPTFRNLVDRLGCSRAEAARARVAPAQVLLTKNLFRGAPRRLSGAQKVAGAKSWWRPAPVMPDAPSTEVL